MNGFEPFSPADEHPDDFVNCLLICCFFVGVTVCLLELATYAANALAALV